jgi:hypothetical protein
MSSFRLSRFFIALIFTLVAVISLQTAFTVTAQTVPTRTPTPPPGEPPDDGDDPPPGGGDDSDSTPVPTSTTQPGVTPTAEAGGAQVTPAVSDDFLPTAEACSMEPTIQSLAAGVNVRSGPGTDYEVAGSLQYLEVRPIIGRVDDVPWWQISLEDGTNAWVSDTVVVVSGYTGAVPTIDPPQLPDGNTPTPGTPWAPTPVPGCTPQPTSTVTATASATPRATGTSSGLSSNQPQTGIVEEASPDRTSEPVETVEATETPEVAEPTEPAATVTPAPLPGEESEDGGGGFPWLPLAGIGLILTAAVIFVVRRGAS